MAIDNKILAEKLQYDINSETARYQHYHQVKLVNMNSLQVKKYCLLIKDK